MISCRGMWLLAAARLGHAGRAVRRAGARIPAVRPRWRWCCAYWEQPGRARRARARAGRGGAPGRRGLAPRRGRAVARDDGDRVRRGRRPAPRRSSARAAARRRLGHGPRALPQRRRRRLRGRRRGRARPGAGARRGGWRGRRSTRAGPAPGTGRCSSCPPLRDPRAAAPAAGGCARILLRRAWSRRPWRRRARGARRRRGAALDRAIALDPRGPRPGSSGPASTSWRSATARPRTGLAQGARPARRRLRARPAGHRARALRPHRRGARRVEPPGPAGARRRDDHRPRAHARPRGPARARGRRGRPAAGGRLPRDRGCASREVGVFPRVRLRIVPREDGRADLEVALTERHGFGPWQAIAATAAADLFARAGPPGLREPGRRRRRRGRRVQVGAHAAAGRRRRSPGRGRWGCRRSSCVSGLRARPTYRFDGGDLMTLRTRGADVALRRVVGPRTVGRGRLAPARAHARRLAAGRAARPHLGGHGGGRARAPGRAARSPGRARSPHTRRERRSARRCATRRRRRRSATRAPSGRIRTTRSSAPGWRRASSYGRGGDGTPLDAMFAVGAGAESEYPLRGHDVKDGGVLGGSPISRSLLLLNVEWRQRLFARFGVAGGGRRFHRCRAAVTGRSKGTSGVLTDVGIGLRLAAGRDGLQDGPGLEPLRRRAIGLFGRFRPGRSKSIK